MDFRRYWKVGLFLGLVIFAAAAIPAQSRPVVERSACRATSGSLSGPRQTCPVYTESYHGGFWVFDASVSGRPTATTTEPDSMPATGDVRTGLRIVPLIAELALAEVLAVPLLLLILALSGPGRRTPVPGAVRRRRHFRLSNRRF